MGAQAECMKRPRSPTRLLVIVLHLVAVLVVRAVVPAV